MEKHGVIQRSSEKIQDFFRRKTVHDILTAVLLFVLFMAMYMTLLADMVFVDEVEVFQNGFLISRGKELYKSVISQHMPVSYYMAALIALFGPMNPYHYRIGFYVLLSVLFVCLYFRHRKVFPPAALVMAPVFYLLSLPYFHMATSMISDHWEGIGIGIILLELLRYQKTKEITAATCVWISLGILLSFGTAFMAAYAILPVVIAVAAIQVYDYTKKGKPERPEFRKKLLREDFRLVGIVLLPMVLLALYYLITGNIGNFYKGAYSVNTEVYSKYLGGYGSSPIGAATGAFRELFNTYKSILSKSIRLDLSLAEILLLIMLISNLIVCTALLIKKHFAAGIAWAVTFVMCGIRGFNGYHSMPYYFVSALSVGLIFAWCMHRMFVDRKYLPAIAVIVGIAFIGSGLPDKVLATKELVRHFPGESGQKVLLDKILDEGDQIHVTDIVQMQYVIDTQRTLDYSAAISTPWTYEAYGEEELNSLRTERPKVVFYLPGGDTWGYKHDEYGKELVDYITGNYTQYEKTDLWIRNDYLKEAKNRLGIRGTSIYLNDGAPNQYLNIDQQGSCTEYIRPDRDLEIVGLGLYTANYMGGCKGTLEVVVKKEAGDETVYRAVLETDDFADCSYNRIHTDPFTLRKDELYSLSISMDNSEKGSLAMALIEDKNQEEEDIKAYSDYENGEDWDYGVYLVENDEEQT